MSRQAKPNPMLTSTPLPSAHSQVPVVYDLRPGDRNPIHFAMKTHTRSSPGLLSTPSRSISQSSRSTKTSCNKSTTPTSSPRAPYSVGQDDPPRSSPAWPSQARPPSPNYFGFVVESGRDSSEFPGFGAVQWSPSSSSIKSFEAPFHKHMSLESDPEFEAFKRQVDINNRKNSFALPMNNYFQPLVNPTPPVRPKPSRWHTHASDGGADSSFIRSLKTAKAGGAVAAAAAAAAAAGRTDGDQDPLHDSAYASSESKRNSESSIFPLQMPNLPRFDASSCRPTETTTKATTTITATATATTTATTNATSVPHLRTKLTRIEDCDPPSSNAKQGPASPSLKLSEFSFARSRTLPPPALDAKSNSMLSAVRLKELMETIEEDRLLLLDIRSFQNFGLSRIRGALNLCVPTTLLKRAAFNIAKLTQMFQGDSEGSKFSTWRDMEWIIVYDASSSEAKDAVTAQNMLKKFTNEGYVGNVGILHGGFNSFQGLFPHLVDHGSAKEKKNDEPGGSNRTLGMAPVIGGVMLPAAANGLDPFFSNIRQNMDLADGVGQLDILCPGGLNSLDLPSWLREAASKSDRGKSVSDKFLQIEREEQTRMKTAYSTFNKSSTGNDGQISQIQLSGVEQGGKNRYKDILPFEHARVRLQNKPTGSCDYVNASHLSSTRSNKRYIASQGPLPATFEDFWSVVWDQDVRVIVMLTAETEGGQVKCHLYWRDREFGPLKLQQLSEEKVSLDLGPVHQPAQDHAEAPYAIVRKFALSHAANPFAPPREITHLHFASWPDFGTPAQPSHLLALVELANMTQRPKVLFDTVSIAPSSGPPVPLSWNDELGGDSAGRPMLVHCSAGCGRTGTFCTVDSVIDMLKRQRALQAASDHTGSKGDVSMVDIDDHNEVTQILKSDPFGQSVGLDLSWLKDDSVDLIQKTVEDFRQQRISMVQSLRQFTLCYETVLEWANRVGKNGLTA